MDISPPDAAMAMPNDEEWVTLDLKVGRVRVEGGPP